MTDSCFHEVYNEWFGFVFSIGAYRLAFNCRDKLRPKETRQRKRGGLNLWLKIGDSSQASKILEFYLSIIVDELLSTNNHPSAIAEPPPVR
ncbi:hypothetical protein M5K25_018966 [Dendrobium thyrsiflorum]|uniref:Uncharacterized protein n=1 Tax=Dendrobium thyrsiflorum TaxID=117978 RepID=A0ABD0UDJ9_DENTH